MRTEFFPFPSEAVLRRVVVSGLGLVTPLGVGVSRVWDRLVSGSCGVRALTPEDLPEVHRRLSLRLCEPVSFLHGYDANVNE